jgi:purine-binding chemotaxis protein CheW
VKTEEADSGGAETSVPGAAPVLHVLFKVDEAEYVVAAADVLQMESFTFATRVPGAPPYVKGLVHIRGRVVPLVDLRLRFGLPPLEPTLDTRIVVLEHTGRTVGLLVDAAREVIRLAPGDLKHPPDLLGARDQGYVEAVAKIGTRLVMLLDLKRVIGEEHIDGK